MQIFIELMMKKQINIVKNYKWTWWKYKKIIRKKKQKKKQLF